VKDKWKRNIGADDYYSDQQQTETGRQADK